MDNAIHPTICATNCGRMRGEESEKEDVGSGARPKSWPDQSIQFNSIQLRKLYSTGTKTKVSTKICVEENSADSLTNTGVAKISE